MHVHICRIWWCAPMAKTAIRILELTLGTSRAKSKCYTKEGPMCLVFVRVYRDILLKNNVWGGKKWAWDSALNGKSTKQHFSNFQPSSSAEPVPTVASDYCFCLTWVEPNEVYCCSDSRFNLLCNLWCLSTHHGCKEWLLPLTWCTQTSSVRHQ